MQRQTLRLRLLAGPHGGIALKAQLRHCLQLLKLLLGQCDKGLQLLHQHIVLLFQNRFGSDERCMVLLECTTHTSDSMATVTRQKGAGQL